MMMNEGEEIKEREREREKKVMTEEERKKQLKNCLLMFRCFEVT